MRILSRTGFMDLWVPLFSLAGLVFVKWIGFEPEPLPRGKCSALHSLLPINLPNNIFEITDKPHEKKDYRFLEEFIFKSVKQNSPQEEKHVSLAETHYRWSQSILWIELRFKWWLLCHCIFSSDKLSRLWWIPEWGMFHLHHMLFNLSNRTWAQLSKQTAITSEMQSF